MHADFWKRNVSFANSFFLAIALGAASLSVGLALWILVPSSFHTRHTAPPQQPRVAAEAAAERQFVLEFRHQPPEALLKQLAQRGYAVIDQLPFANAVIVQASDAVLQRYAAHPAKWRAIAADLRELTGAVSVTQDVPVVTLGRLQRLVSPNYVVWQKRSFVWSAGKMSVIDGRSGLLGWGIDAIDAERVWKKTTGSPSVTVAVVDTGIDDSHPLLKGAVVGGRNFVFWQKPRGKRAWKDRNGHGTAVAGIIAARYRPEVSPYRLGIAPGVKLLAVRVADKDGLGTFSSVLRGIKWAIRKKADIIVLSVGSYCPPKDRECWYANKKRNKILWKAARKRGIILVAGAGNNVPTADYFFPAASPGVISVGGIVPYIKKVPNVIVAPWSAHGSTLDFVAPSNAFSTYINGGYVILGGTSAAAPHVAGTVALMLSVTPHKRFDMNQNGRWEVDEVYRALKVTADDIVRRGFDEESGWGVIDAEEAVLGVQTGAPVCENTCFWK